MKRTFLLGSALLMALGVNVASAQQDVSKTWSTGEFVNGTIEEWSTGQAPRGYGLSATEVYDASNKYQYTEVMFHRWGRSMPDTWPFTVYDRTLTCYVQDPTFLKVSDAMAEIPSVVLDPAAPQCTTSGWRLECDESWNCTYDENRGFSHPATVAGKWAKPAYTDMATSQVHTALATQNDSQRTNMTCRSNSASQFGGGGLTIDGVFTNFGGGPGFDSYGDIYQNRCQTISLSK